MPRIKYWLSVGAQPSDTVARLLGASGLLESHPRSFRDPVANIGEEADNIVNDGTSGGLKPTNPASRGMLDALGSLESADRRAAGVLERQHFA